jgi:hypothetical protein
LKLFALMVLIFVVLVGVVGQDAGLARVFCIVGGLVAFVAMLLECIEEEIR